MYYADLNPSSVSHSLGILTEFDYIIVGAGSAGCVLASRLSENVNNRVLLLEAGEWDRGFRFRMPTGLYQLVLGSKFNWSYQTEPEAELHGRRLKWPRGKVVGGSSSINAMIYMRGHPQDYDAWANSGLTGWAYNDVLPYFLRSENSERGKNKFHGIDGPLHVTTRHWEDELTNAFLQAGLDQGYGLTDDFNGESPEGFAYFDTTMRNGRRSSASDAFLHPVLFRPNLSVHVCTQVTRVLFELGRATGVEFIQDGKVGVASARCEVILCAGAINSPQILMLSGIGPAENLQDVGIKVIRDCPGVGSNLQDHLSITLKYEALMPVSAFKWIKVSRRAQLFLNWLFFKRGFGSFAPVPAGALIKSSVKKKIPDLQVHFMPFLIPQSGSTSPDRHGYQCHVCQLRPKSRGEVTLVSKDPLKPPRVSPKYLSHSDDLLVLRLGLKRVRDLLHNRAFDKYRGLEVLPGPTVRSDEELDEIIRKTSASVHHQAGTCQMGADETSVVDGQLQVRGVKGLRVVDASIMPSLVGGNINAPTIMIAEKAADMILGKEPEALDTYTRTSPPGRVV